jgi:hypothetical protein
MRRGNLGGDLDKIVGLQVRCELGEGHGSRRQSLAAEEQDSDSSQRGDRQKNLNSETDPPATCGVILCKLHRKPAKGMRRRPSRYRV